MDFQKLITRYRQFGGLRLVWEYAKLGALWPAVKAGVMCLKKRQSFKGIYPIVLKRVEPHFIEMYTPTLKRVLGNLKSEENPDQNLSRIGELENRPIWFCWLQGLEQAPPIVHACYNSLKRHLTDREIRVIDNSNWREYVELPGYMWRNGRRGGFLRRCSRIC